MKNKKGPLSGLFSFIIFILFMQFFITGRDINFSYIIVIFFAFGGIQYLFAFLNKQAKGNKKYDSSNEFNDFDQNSSFNYSSGAQKGQVECEYCGHMNDMDREYCENCGAQQLPPDQY
jgi:hypothetical protein